MQEDVSPITSTVNHTKCLRIYLIENLKQILLIRNGVPICESVGITQSMSRAGCPYDNAPMARYYNTLKNELINHYEEELYEAVEEFAYVHYNHERPHSYNNYKTPFEACYEA